MTLVSFFPLLTLLHELLTMGFYNFLNIMVANIKGRREGKGVNLESLIDFHSLWNIPMGSNIYMMRRNKEGIIHG